MSTIGVSIPVPDPHGALLQDARRATGDPLADAIPAHVTLCPPTDVADLDLAAFTAHLEQVAAVCAPFELMLRGTGTFRPVSPVVFVAVAAGIVECEQIEQQVRAGPIDRELEFPYHPHVTVAHGVPAQELDRVFTELADYSCRFTVDGFWMYEQGPDQVWRPTREFSFGRATGQSSPQATR